MFDIGWSELLVIAVVAIVVVGPKDLPRALRTVGQWAAKVRGIAREFQSSVDDMIRESELDELRRETQALAKIDLDDTGPRRIEPIADAEGGYDPPPEADEEAAADAYNVEGAMAPPHSLAEPEAAEPGAPAAPEEAETAAPTRASG